MGIARPTALSARVASPRIVVVDADESQRSSTVSMLRDNQLTALPVASGGAFIEWLADTYTRPAGDTGTDLLVSAAHVPGITMLDLLLDLRRMGWRVPVIVVVDPDEPDQVVPARRLAIREPRVAVMSRPLAERDLLSVVHYLLHAGSRFTHSSRVAEPERSQEWIQTIIGDRRAG